MELRSRGVDRKGAGERDARTARPDDVSRPLPSRRQWTPLGRALTVTGDNWTLIIALQLACGRTRLSELRARLAGVSAGVLDRYLRQMARAGLITRTRFREMPPRVEIELTESGRELLPIAGALARWGLRRAWSEPREGEQVDIDALLRLLPVLLAGASGLPDAEIELILHEDIEESRYRFTVRGGQVLVASPQREREQTPFVRIRGDRGAWTATLGPAADISQLRLGGDQAIARRVLAALHASEQASKAGHRAA
jgi:DNA-binding HxlR family transcriptional regulator